MSLFSRIILVLVVMAVVMTGGMTLHRQMRLYGWIKAPARASEAKSLPAMSGQLAQIQIGATR
jgi:hypothetical protein